MRALSFGREHGRRIDRFDSDFVLARLARSDGVHVACMYLQPGGRVGRHPAVAPQLFAVVEGEGWAAGSDGRRVALRSGEAVLWTAGESHEAGTEVGMVAIVVETDLLSDDPATVGPLP